MIRTYYINIKDNESLYLSCFNERNVDGLFTIGDTASSVTLKDEYKELLSAELLEVTDESYLNAIAFVVYYNTLYDASRNFKETNEVYVLEKIFNEIDGVEEFNTFLNNEK